MIGICIFGFAWILRGKGRDSLKILSTLSEKMLILLRANGIAIKGNFSVARSCLTRSVRRMADDRCRWQGLAYWHPGTAFAGQYCHGHI